MPKALAPNTIDRRTILSTAAVAATSASLGLNPGAATAAEPRKSWAALPPAGFVRMSMPGKVVKVTQAGCLQKNGAYPKAQAAETMLAQAMTALTGKASLRDAFGMFIHPDDVVAIKPNGIAGKKSMKMASNKEVVVAIAKALVALGVPPENITVFEQYRDFLYATRCITDKDKLTPATELPAGVKTMVHLNTEAEMDHITVGAIPTKFVTPFTRATAVINVPQLKDHAICGYTGALKNITHGATINPQHFHEHGASPQIAHLYAQDVVKSRVHLHIKDAYQVIYDGGPIDKLAHRRIPYESLYVSTDPVALDVVGWKVVEGLRKDNGLPTLKAAGREPTYLRIASQLGLGVFDDKQIDLRELKA
jgi:uncharacterized protein (DUF362 family)